MKSRVAGFAAFLFVAANAQACSVSGTAFTAHGHKVPGAVVRLTDLDASQSAAFAVADANAMFAFDGAASGQRMRLDLLSAPTVVTGSLLSTRSIVGQSEIFACTNAQMIQDLQAAVD